MSRPPSSWMGIVRLGLVQSALGAIVTMATSTLNRVMVVEEGVAAVIPAALVAFHYVVQLSRPHWGYGSDVGHRRTPWIIGGMGVLALGAIAATDATLMMATSPLWAAILALVAYSMIGGGVGAAGTSLLALLATRVDPPRRAAAASITWIMMIVGIVVSASVAGALLQPFSAQRLAEVVSMVAGVGFLMTLFAVWGGEGTAATATGREAQSPSSPPSFAVVIREIRADPTSRRFTLFVFVSMLAYSAQELILEPFAGLVFRMSPGQTAQLTGLQHGGVLLGMILVGIMGARIAGPRALWMRRWTLAGCLGSSAALLVLALSGLGSLTWLLSPTVMALGFANGVFAVAAIGSMMGLAGAGRESREGVRMGVWGAAQAAAFAVGGFAGATGVGLMRGVFHASAPAFTLVFCAEATIFLVAALLASGLRSSGTTRSDTMNSNAKSLEFGGVHG